MTSHDPEDKLLDELDTCLDGIIQAITDHKAAIPDASQRLRYWIMELHRLAHPQPLKGKDA